MRSARYDAKALTRAVRAALKTPSDVAMFRVVARDGGAFFASFTVCDARTHLGWTQITLREDGGSWFTVRTPKRLFVARSWRVDGCTKTAFLEWNRNAFRHGRSRVVA